MDNIENILQALGLSDKETLVYSTLLDTGRSSAHRIAKESGLKRTTTYNVLDDLQELGLVHIIQDSARNQYKALSPNLLVERRKNELKKIENIVPNIEARLKDTGLRNKPHVQFYEGVDGINRIRNYKINEMKDQTIYGFFATAGDKVQKEFNYFKEYEKTIQKLNIKYKGVAPDDPDNLGKHREADAGLNREVKALALDKYSSNISIEIGETWVKTNDFKNLQGLVIENEEFAKTMREIFELVWEKTN